MLSRQPLLEPARVRMSMRPRCRQPPRESMACGAAQKPGPLPSRPVFDAQAGVRRPRPSRRGGSSPRHPSKVSGPAFRRKAASPRLGSAPFHRAKDGSPVFRFPSLRVQKAASGRSALPFDPNSYGPTPPPPENPRWFFGEVRLVPTLFQQTKPTAHHAAVDGFEHIVNHRSRAGDGQGLHLNTDFADAGRFGFDTQLVFLRLRRHHDFIQGQGWQKGIPSGVRSAACTAAARAVGNPSGLGSSSAKRRGMDSRSSLIKTSALA